MTVMAAAMLTACGGGGGGEPSTSDATGFATSAASTDASQLSAAEAGMGLQVDAATALQVASAAETTNSLAADAGAELAPSDERTEHLLAAKSGSPAARRALDGTGTATVSWEAPASQANGDAVGTLAGYKVYFGDASGKYLYSTFVPGGTAATLTVAGLTNGTWYFAVSAVNTEGDESTLGYEMSKSL
jgi:hypothetical protein